METIQIIREKHELPDATLGIMYRDGEAICATLELPWLSNQRKISCIPKGIYKTGRFKSPRNGEVFQLRDVPNRTAIQIHSGNIVDDIEGCILVGRTHGTLYGKRAVLNSRNTMMILREELPETFLLSIE